MLPDPATADALIAAELPRLPAEDCPLAHAHGRVLRSPVRADRPMPPFDRVTMDGYAVRAGAVAAGQRRFRVIGMQAAGMIPLALDGDDTCVEVATGAVLPSGADAVVPYEQTEPESAAAGEDAGRGPRWIALRDGMSVGTGDSVHRRGSDAAAGDVLVAPGTRLHGGAIAVAAACGVAFLTVAARPSIAVVVTGDELVEVEAGALAPHQIRRSNDHVMRAALAMSGLAGRIERFHLRDLRHEVETGLQRVLAEFDIVLLSGGVSKGKFDFVPSALAALGVREKLRGVAQRPGKPMWFGVSSRRRPVFALPGNPVSAYTCLHRYVLPALRQMAGGPPAPGQAVVLSEPVSFAPALTYFLPVVLRTERDGRRSAAPAPFNTSGDLGGLVGTDGFVELPADRPEFPEGTVVAFWPWS